MSEWIEINLPWTTSILSAMDRPDYPEMPDLDRRVKEVFGTTTSEEWGKITRKDHSRYETSTGSGATAHLQLMKKMGDEYDTISQEAFSRKLEETGIPAVLKVLSYHKLRRRIEDWYKDQPEVIAWEAAKQRWQEEQHQKSFTGRGLNKPGTLVEVFDGDVTKQFLIGDINTLAGVCDDCTAFDGYTVIVKRYKVVWTPP